MMTAAATDIAIQLDIRDFLPGERQPSIFAAFRGIRPRETLEVVIDHDPTALYHQFRVELAGAFLWDVLTSGPELWRIHITKLGDPIGDGRRCGQCGGH